MAGLLFIILFHPHIFSTSCPVSPFSPSFNFRVTRPTGHCSPVVFSRHLAVSAAHHCFSGSCPRSLHYRGRSLVHAHFSIKSGIQGHSVLHDPLLEMSLSLYTLLGTMVSSRTRMLRENAGNSQWLFSVSVWSWKPQSARLRRLKLSFGKQCGDRSIHN